MKQQLTGNKQHMNTHIIKHEMIAKHITHNASGTTCWLAFLPAVCLAGWLAGRLAGWPAGWPAGLLAGCLALQKGTTCAIPNHKPFPFKVWDSSKML